MEKLDFPIPLSSEELQILSLIKKHDCEHPIPNMEIQAKTGIPERRIRRIVSSLIIDYKQPIGSTTTPPGGYYWIEDLKEAERNYKRLKRRGLVILKRAATLKGIAMSELVNQIKLELEGGQDETTRDSL